MPTHFHTIYDWSSGSNWIADGDCRLARLEIPRLRDLVLRPGYAPMVTWLTLFWWQYTANETPGRSAWITDELQLDDCDPACYNLFLRTHNTDRSVESRCRLKLTYEAGIDSYIYAIDTELVVSQGREWLIEPQGGVEFANPWYKDAVGSATSFQGSVLPRWTWVVYTDLQGNTIRLPLNHLNAPLLGQILFPASGGWLGFFNHPDGNPVIEIGPDTARSTRAEVCAWGYDAHFILRTPAGTPWNTTFFEGGPPQQPILLQAGQKLAAQYSLYQLSETEGARLLESSIQPSLPQALAARLSRPAYRHPMNTFSEGVWPEAPDTAWYWSPSHGDGVTWDRQLGRLDKASLCIQNQTVRYAYWFVPVGSDFWMKPLENTAQRLGGWIRTNEVSGTGAYLSFRYSDYQIETGQMPPFTEYASPSITGTQDWTYVELTAPPPPSGATRAYLRLILDGTGMAWFDDVALKAIDPGLSPTGQPA